MKIIVKKEKMTKIETEVYQGKNGGIYINWGNNAMLLPEEFANTIANDLDILDTEDYRKFYNQ